MKRCKAVPLKLDAGMHDAFVRLHGSDGCVPSYAFYEIRRHRQHPWRLLARRVQEARRAGAPREQVKEIAHVLERYIDQIYDEGAA